MSILSLNEQRNDIKSMFFKTCITFHIEANANVIKEIAMNL